MLSTEKENPTPKPVRMLYSVSSVRVDSTVNVPSANMPPRKQMTDKIMILR
ncbi:hypothetical protein D1872_221420 [compost metagenome]